jgi:hypothetical protein
MELNLSLVVISFVVIIGIIVVICIIAYLNRAKAHHNEHHHSDLHRSSDHHHKSHLAHSALGPVNFEEVWSGDDQVNDFPRHSAKASKPVLKVESVQADETVELDFSADLFSVKEDILSDLDMTQEELDAEMAKYKAKYEYKRRQLPVNKNFNMEDYNKAQQFLKDSPVNLAAARERGEGREDLSREIAKKKALARLRKKPDDMPSGHAAFATPDQVAAIRNPHRNNLGKLIAANSPK